MIKSSLLIFLLVIASLNDGYSQQNLPYDTLKISSAQELNFAFTYKRGIETTGGIIYYVEKDLRTLAAYEKGKLKWKTDIIKGCGERVIGIPEIRFIKLENDKIYIVFGKHSFADVHRSDGKLNCLGAD